MEKVVLILSSKWKIGSSLLLMEYAYTDEFSHSKFFSNEFQFHKEQNLTVAHKTAKNA